MLSYIVSTPTIDVTLTKRNDKVTYLLVRMKYILTLAILFMYSVAYNQIVIQGQIKNYDGRSKVYYSPTVDGILAAFDNVSNEIQPNASGRFKITYENKGLSSTRIGFSGLTYSFVHDQNSKISFAIDQARINIPKNRKSEKLTGDNLRDSVKQAATISIEGDFAEINRFNNRMVRSSTVAFRVQGCYYSKLIERAKTPSEAISILDSLTQIELDQIDMLATPVRSEMNSSKATPEVKRFLETQVHSFYGTVFLTGMMLKRIGQATLLLKTPEAPDSIYSQAWEDLIESYFLNASRKITPLPASFEYNEFILSSAYTLENYNKYDFNPPVISDEELVIERLLQPQRGVLDSLHLVNEQAILAYKIHNLSRFLYTQTFYSPTLLGAVNILKEQYPDSKLIKPYAPKIDALNEYLEKSASSYDKFKIIETNYIYFNDLLEAFRGQNLLIDIWATWCAPCVDDFNYKSVLRPFIDQKSITVLYISIDKVRWKNKWKENIKFNELEGYHVLADNVLIQDMWKELGGREGLIPRYALIDKNGSIYLDNAARPSEGEKLVQQIQSMLKSR